MSLPSNLAKIEALIRPYYFKDFWGSSYTRDLSMKDIMSYELSPFPAALFEANEIIRKEYKAQVLHAVLNIQERNKVKLSWIIYH